MRGWKQHGELHVEANTNTGEATTIEIAGAGAGDERRGKMVATPLHPLNTSSFCTFLLALLRELAAVLRASASSIESQATNLTRAARAVRRCPTGRFALPPRHVTPVLNWRAGVQVL